MKRAELVEQVRRLADQTAYLAAEVRRGDTALELLGQVRDFGHRLPPGLAADIRRVVDDMVATRHEAHGEPSCSPRSGTSSAGGSGQRPPAAPSTETGQAAQDGQSGSGGDAMDGVPAHQPTPQVGDVWQCGIGRLRVRSVSSDTDGLTWTATNGMKYRGIPWGDWRLVERDGRPWPTAQESQTEADVEPATDADIERIEADVVRGRPARGDDTLAVIARLRQTEALAEKICDQYLARWDTARRERDEAREAHDRAQTRAAHAESSAATAEYERGEAVALQAKAEANLVRVERVTDLERAVVEATLAREAAHDEFKRNPDADISGTCQRYRDAVRALREVQGGEG